MDRIIFNDINHLVEHVINNKKIKDDDDVGIICPYDYAAWIIESMIGHGISIEYIDYADYTLDGYNKEYQISILDHKLWCEPLYIYRDADDKLKSGYVYSCADMIFIHQDCNSEILKHIDCNKCYEFAIDVLDDTDEEKEIEDEFDGTITSNGISIARLKDGKPEGFTKSWHLSNDNGYRYMSFSYNSDDMEDLKHIAEIFGIDI